MSGDAVRRNDLPERPELPENATWEPTFSGARQTWLAGKPAAKCAGHADETSSEQSEGAGFWRGSCVSDIGEDEGVVVIVEVRAGEGIQTGDGEVLHADEGAGEADRESGEPTGVGGGIGVIVSIAAEGCRDTSIVDGRIEHSFAVVRDDEDEVVASIDGEEIRGHPYRRAMVGNQKAAKRVLGGVPKLNRIVAARFGAGEVAGDDPSGGGCKAVSGGELAGIRIRDVVGE
jgi:hypothetical protein